MSKRLPSLRPTEVVRTLEKAGWYIRRQKGSHIIMHKTGSPNLIVIPCTIEICPGELSMAF